MSSPRLFRVFYPSRQILSVVCLLVATSKTASMCGQDTTVQLPTFGVAIDAAGVLEVKQFADPGGRLRAQRIAAARASLPPDLTASSDLRKISLVRLERAVRRQLDRGQPPDEVMRNLAGLQRLKFVFCFPERGDIVIAGPAEGYVSDAAGRTVGISTQQPVLQLDDLLVALRAYPPGTNTRPFIGCTIDPNPDGLKRLLDFQRTIPKTIPQYARQQVAEQIARGSRQALGAANIRVFGIPPDTNFARVLVEADYRMKLIGVGIEPPPLSMATFLGSLRNANEATLQRWWFTPDYDCLRVTDDRLALELVGRSVKLHGEDKMIGAAGQLADRAAGTRSNPASDRFTAAFTKLYPEIAARRPVYAQMRNLIDMLVAAAFVRQQQFYEQSGWSAATFVDAAALPTESVAAPASVACVVNSVWKGNRLFTPAGGGVSIRADLALDRSRWQTDDSQQLQKARSGIEWTAGQDDWWWD